MTSRLDIIKTGVSTIVGIGTTKIVHAIIENNTDPETVTDQVTITAGSAVLGYMVAERSSQYTSAKIDDIASWWKSNVTK